jgi:cyclase
MPCLLVKSGRLVKTKQFDNPQYIGDPINAVKIYNEKEVDELVLLDISATKEHTSINFDLLRDFASECFMPLSYGGGVKSLSDFKKIYALGIEKIIVNSLIFEDPSIISQAVADFGSQSVVASVDVKKIGSQYFAINHIKPQEHYELSVYIEKIKQMGFGEILITSIDREGTWDGFDFNLISFVNSKVSIPVIAHGGAKNNEDIKKAFEIGVSGVAIGNMAVYQKKDKGVLIRFPNMKDIF